MALVNVKISGQAEVRQFSVSTIGELKTELSLSNYSAAVNGSPQNDNFELSDAQLVTLAPSVKGGKQ